MGCLWGAIWWKMAAKYWAGNVSFNSIDITLAYVKFCGGNAIHIDPSVDRENFDPDKWRANSIQGYVIPKWSRIIIHGCSFSTNQAYLQNSFISHHMHLLIPGDCFGIYSNWRTSWKPPTNCYIHAFFVWRRHDNMFPWTGSRSEFHLRANCAMHWMPTSNCGPQRLRHCYVERANHSAMTLPSKTELY